MILSVLDLSDRVAREVMVPRIDVQALDIDASIDEVFELAVQSGHSRLPIYEKTIDHIVGQLYTKDLLKIATTGEKPALRDVMRPVHYTVESKRISELLQELLSRKLQLCVVVDEFGGTAGILTVEDIIEEIVGEIRDEYDTHEEADFKPLASGNGYSLDAGMPIDDVNKLLQVELKSEASDTIGGYLYDQLGEVPKTGATFEDVDAGHVFEVTQVDDRRILRINAIRINHAQQAQHDVIDTP
jgi:CBS domain containing-hemolysin-like protein